MIPETAVDGDGVEHREARYFQKPDGRLPLSPVDTDARWRTSRPGKPAGLHYQENIIIDLSGFIVSIEVTHAEELPTHQKENGRRSLACWSNCPSGQCRWPETAATTSVNCGSCLRNGISPPTSPFIPFRKPSHSGNHPIQETIPFRKPSHSGNHPIQETIMVSRGGFAFDGDHLVCPQGMTLRRGSFH